MGPLEPRDRLLLRAALLEGDAARAAWTGLSPDFDLDPLDHGRTRILPLLHRNLLRLGIEDARLPRLRGVRHYAWARNQVRLRTLMPLVRRLHAEGIETLLLKGAALLAACLPDFSLRPMDDIDLLVRPGDVARTLPLLAASGYQPVNVKPWSIVPLAMQDGPGYPFINANGDELDLHWHALHDDRRPSADVGLWAAARPARLFGTPTLVPCPADLLLQICAHAAGWSQTHGLRWVADLLVILRSAGPAFDWARLESEAITHRVAPALHAALTILRRDLDQPVPEQVLAGLRRRVTWFGRREMRLRGIAPDGLSSWQRRFLDLCAFRRSRDYLMHRPLLRALPSYLRARNQADTRVGAALRLGFGALGRPTWLRRLLPLDRLRSVPPDEVPPLGTTVGPAAPASARAVFREGWSYFEPAGRWTLGPEARLAWRLPPQAGDVTVQIEGHRFAPPGQALRPIEFWIGRTRLACWPTPARPAAGQTLRLTVPARLLRGHPLLILSIVVRRPIAPLDIGYNADPRALGLFLRRARATADPAGD